MTGHIERAGPSGAAKRRMNRVLLCLVDHCAEDPDASLTISAIKGLLSDPMSRADADSAIRRLTGAEQIERIPDSHPAAYRPSERGQQMAVKLILRGERY
jgi:hypothetical protein